MNKSVNYYLIVVFPFLAIKIFDKTTAAFSLKSVDKRLHPFNIRLEMVKTDNVQEINSSIFDFEMNKIGSFCKGDDRCKCQQG